MLKYGSMKKVLFAIFFISLYYVARPAQIFIPMDNSQTNHLKAYGVVYWVLTYNVETEWLLNFKGGSFMFQMLPVFEKECKLRGVSYQIISDGESQLIKEQISDLNTNQDAVKLTKAPKVAVYAPKTTQPWDDAVMLALTYAEIPYDIIYDEDVLKGILPTYDWLHLHHEDFTGQYGKFWASYRNAPWYIEEVKEAEQTAKALGFNKVSQLKLAVAKKIRDFVAGGGYLFAMCSASDSFDVALSAEGVDICESVFDGDPMDPQAQQKLDFTKTLAFTNFSIVKNPAEYEISSIDATHTRRINPKDDFFVLFEFSAKWDPVPTMLTQNHEKILKGFMGQTTAFRNEYIKSGVVVMAENKALGEARYIHSEFGKGFWTFYSGHDPEDYQHLVYDPPTELDMYPTSPGYRLILNNVLFPAAKKQKQKT